MFYPYRFPPSIESTHTMKTGIVKWFNNDKNYGFIAQDEGGPDLFVHSSNISEESAGWPVQNARVEYEVSSTQKGPCAVNVRVL